MKKKILCLIIVLMAALSLPAAMPDYSGAKAYAAAEYGSRQMEAFARKLVSDVNTERAAAGLAPLKFCDSLNEVAILRAKECEAKFDHIRPDGSDWFSALDQADIPYYTAGENIAWGQNSPEAVMQAWMNSEERGNILSENYEYIGIGVYCSGGTYYWTQVFTGGLEIEGEVVPYIISQPKNVSLPESSTALFEVNVYGRNLSYQWYFKKAGASGWSVWNSHQSASTTAITNQSWNGMQVRCIITDSTGMELTSEPAVVTIIKGPVITSQPQNVTAAPGAKVSFEVKALGRDLSYQWYYKKAGASSWNRWNSHTTAVTYASCNDSWNGMQVYCKVTDGGGISVDSETAAVTLKQTIFITSQPENITVFPGNRVDFTVAASGSDIRFQWYYKKAGAADWSRWNAHTTASTTAVANESWNGMQVYCKVYDDTGAFVNSANAVVTVITDFTVKRQPVSVYSQPGRSVSFSVIAKGESLKYQWYYKKSGDSDWSLWNGHTAAVTSAIVNESWNGIQVRCLITGKSGQSIYSATARVTFAGEITVTGGPENVIATEGESVKLSASAQGDGLSCQWYYKKAGATGWSAWSGMTSQKCTCVVQSDWDEMQVFCLFTDQYGNTASSGYATIYLA